MKDYTKLFAALDEPMGRRKLIQISELAHKDQRILQALWYFERVLADAASTSTWAESEEFSFSFTTRPEYQEAFTAYATRHAELFTMSTRRDPEMWDVLEVFVTLKGKPMKTQLGRGRTFDINDDTTGFRKCRKTAEVEALRIDQPFRVITLDGTMYGKPGDYLMRGVKGELYPCAAEIFERTYEWTEPEETDVHYPNFEKSPKNEE